MTSREESVLAARDPSLQDENDWQEFSLSDVKVLFPGKSRYANLLTASPDNPLQVIGTLDEVEEEQASLVLDDDYLSKRIVIDNVTHYAYGQHADGEVGIWVAGQAGWFLISPARGYRPMFNDMTEAIDLLYFLADRHQRKGPRRKKWNPSVEWLCEEYVSHSHGICEDADDSAEAFYKHHEFLLARMLKDDEGVEWTKTKIFEHLCEKFPDDYEQIKEVHDRLHGDSEMAIENDDRATDEKKPIVNGRRKHAEKHDRDEAALSKGQAEIIYQVIQDLREAGHLAKRQLNLDLVASTLVERFDIDTVDDAHEVIAARAQSLLGLMDEARTPTFDWSRKAIYRELKILSTQRDKQYAALTPLRPRLAEEGADESSSGDDEDESGHDADHPKMRRRRVRKSVLRPMIGSKSAKLIGKRTRAGPAADDQDDASDHSEEAEDDLETPSKIRGHDLVRDPLSIRARRRTGSILLDPENVLFETAPLQDSLHSANASVSVADVDGADAEQSLLDSLPPDTWVCQVQGCGKIVYKSSTKRGREMIQDHSLAHADDVQTKLDLVFAEQRLNVNVSVGNLISRIRDFGTLESALPAMKNEFSADAGD